MRSGVKLCLLVSVATVSHGQFYNPNPSYNNPSPISSFGGYGASNLQSAGGANFGYSPSYYGGSPYNTYGSYYNAAPVQTNNYNANSYNYNSYNVYSNFNGYNVGANQSPAPPTTPTFSWGGAPFQTPVSGTYLNSRGSQTCGCESTWKPVCVNGVTYANACDALCLGMPEKSIGQCGAPFKMQMFWQRFAPGSDCNCPKTRQPVCANAVTYENNCVALCRGVKNYLVGECDAAYWGPNVKQDNGYGGSTGDLVPVVFVGGCANSQYGCCPDGSSAKGWYGEGCPSKQASTMPPTTKPPTPKAVNCATTKFGCCPNGFPATGPLKGQGCTGLPPTPAPKAVNCAATPFGCCSNGTPAPGPTFGAGCTDGTAPVRMNTPPVNTPPMNTGLPVPSSFSSSYPITTGFFTPSSSLFASTNTAYTPFNSPSPISAFPAAFNNFPYFG
mmetsp:Transcript_46924/g.92369  ORF Transcript_46924/g.92369 Transcript_46924/m.92369 type:complete len:443 (+) Transcript_46924:25-1353(+)|eukprot:CAMPEP_0175142886 /NCGR_PEP_ID=MMETSP0087-20121206/13085_1 /TAXON_ID=136419 /ORGANISM="Unknown Unknown, Strain D1" /LENGTH=442 /DNA_ID=CAMNT_0016426813 /DNA_START=25 /DNA_END=1353 /DNA_ORIENTATION=+